MFLKLFNLLLFCNQVLEILGSMNILGRPLICLIKDPCAPTQATSGKCTQKQNKKVFYGKHQSTPVQTLTNLLPLINLTSYEL